MLKCTQEFRSFVKDRRDQLHKSQKEVAREVGVAQGTIGNLESGLNIRLYPQIIKGLAGALETTTEELLRLLTEGDIPPELALLVDESKVRRSREKLVTAEDLAMLAQVRESFGEMFTLDLVIDLIRHRHRKEDSCSKVL